MKPKDDIHVLDWSRITKYDIDKQSSNRQENLKPHKNKGILFEDLVEKLLSAMVPNEKWSRTAESHDGKRDFFYPADSYLPEQKWAECKNYNSNVSINTISPTLVMGALNNIECIYFFSYSPLNDNAIESILRYSKSSNKTVKIFDGNLLESLICHYHMVNNISSFFPNTNFTEARAKLNKRQLRLIRTIKDMNGNIISPEHLFELGEYFYINVIVQNLSSAYIDYDLELKFRVQDCLSYDEDKLSYGLPFGEIKEHSILCNTLKPSNMSYSINVVTKNNREKGITNLKKTGQIKILDEQYLFWTGENALSVYKNCTNHLSNYATEPIIIMAESGMGKSTLLNIFKSDIVLREKYTIINIDLNLARNYCVRNLFYQIFGVNFMDETPEEQKGDDDQTLSLLVNEYAASANMIAENMMKFYKKKKPFLFIIDDAQLINRAYIDLLAEINGIAEKNNVAIYYVFALNEDKLSLNSLLSRLNWDLNYKSCNYFLNRLSKFNKTDIISFLKHKFGLTNIEKYFEDSENLISPLDLHAFALDLKNNHIISRISKTSTYQIVDTFKFAENINKILFSNVSIKNICTTIDLGDVPEYLIKYLSISEEIKPDTRKNYSKAIDKLIVLGILKEQENTIVFKHEKIKNCIIKSLDFVEEDYVDIFYDENTNMVAKAMCALNLIEKIKTAPKFLHEFFESRYEIHKASQRYNLCWLIFEYMDKLIKYDLVQKALNFVRKNLNALNDEQNYENYLKFLTHIADSVQNIVWNIDEESIENLAYFIKKFLDRMISTHNEKKIYQYYLKFKNIILKLNGISETRKFYWLSHYSNRAAISLDRESSPCDDESNCISLLYNESKKYCENAGSPEELLLQIKIDNFYRNYAYRHNLTCDIVCNTIMELKNLNREKLTRTTCLDYHIILLEYLKIKFNETEYDSEKLCNLKCTVEKIRLKSNSAFYTLKMHLLEIYILLDLKCYAEAQNSLIEAFDFAYKKGMRHSIYKLSYIQANLILFDKSLHGINNFDYAIVALEQFIDANSNTINGIKREIFIIRRLIELINGNEPIEVFKTISKKETQTIINYLMKFYSSNGSKSLEEVKLFEMDSYFVINGVSFPTI